MKYDRFEALPVWQAAQDIGLQIFALTDDRAFSSASGLKDQIRRAAVSVSNNIAEGFERGSTAELLAFLYIASGGAGVRGGVSGPCHHTFRANFISK